MASNGPRSDQRNANSSQLVRDIIIGMCDGLTVPFALATGLCASKASNRIVVTAGLAEIAAASIAMGLGGYLAAKSDGEFYRREEKREKEMISATPEKEAAEVAEILEKYGLQPKEYWPVVEALKKRPNVWLDFMMKFELGLEEPDPHRALQSAFTIAVSYIIGGVIPLLPYMAVSPIAVAFFVSMGVTIIALCVFGFIKGHCRGSNPFRTALETVIVGVLACGAAFCIARLMESNT